MSADDEFDRGAFHERETLDETGERKAPSVAEAGGKSPVSMRACLAMGAGTLMAIWLLVILPMQSEADEASAIKREKPAVERTERAVNREYPGTGFDAAETAPPRHKAAAQEPANSGNEALRLEVRRLQLELERLQQASNQQARSLALQMQLEAARAAEEDRVKRLRSDIVIRDFGKPEDRPTGRDVPDLAPLREGTRGAGPRLPQAAPDQRVDPIEMLQAIRAATQRDNETGNRIFRPPLLDEHNADDPLTVGDQQ